MDRDALRAALDRWTDEGVIDESTAARIREFEGVSREPTGAETPREEPTTDAATNERLLGEDRVVLALALMGGVLVAAGIGAFLFEQWASIPVAGRVAILVGTPVAAAAGGARLREPSPRTAHGLWLLAALFTGVTVFRLASLAAAVDVAAARAWLLAAWTAVVVAIAAGLDSRPIGGAGAVLGGATVVAATAPAEFVLVLGCYGGLVYAAGLRPGGGDSGTTDGTEASLPRVTETFRWVGGAFTVAAVVPVVAVGSPPEQVSGGTVALTAAAVVAAAGVWRASADRTARYATVPAVAAPAAAVTVWGVAGRVGDLGGSVVALGALLAFVVSLVVGAVGLREPAPANVAALGFVLGVLAFLVGPVGEAISGSLALVAAGAVLLAAGLGAERGRRAVLAKIG
jgi:uncharacterized membrane protein